MELHETIQIVYNALLEKGYDPIVQISSYLLVGDPSYITSHNNARNLISKIDRYELMHELTKAYLKEFEENKMEEII